MTIKKRHVFFWQKRTQKKYEWCMHSCNGTAGKAFTHKYSWKSVNTKREEEKVGPVREGIEISSSSCDDNDKSIEEDSG